MKFIPDWFPLYLIPRWRRCIWLASLAGLCVGCTPVSEEERAFFQERAREREALEQTTQTLQGSTRYAEAMAMVKEHQAAGAGGSNEEWVTRTVEERTRNALFPRWKVLPRGGDRYEVRYEYTLMEEDYKIEKKGFAWNVDLRMKIVSPHRELSDAELQGRQDSRVSQISQQQRRNREREETFSLE